MRRRARVLKAPRPNAGLAADYKRRIEALIDEMHGSVLYWMTAQWRKNPPATLAADQAPVTGLRIRQEDLREHWMRRMDEASGRLARYFAKRAVLRGNNELQKILRDAGIAVEFKLSAAAADVMRATIAENTRLIKSIAEEHLSKVEGVLLRSSQMGGDLGTATKEIESTYQLTRKRAALIARDQNAKATAAIVRVRQQEAGINRAKWLHSGAGKHPRPDHVAFSRGKLGGPYYDVDKGAFISNEWIYPGQLINCRCVSASVIEGF